MSLCFILGSSSLGVRWRGNRNRTPTYKEKENNDSWKARPLQRTQQHKTRQYNIYKARRRHPSGNSQSPRRSRLARTETVGSEKNSIVIRFPTPPSLFSYCILLFSFLYLFSVCVLERRDFPTFEWERDRLSFPRGRTLFWTRLSRRRLVNCIVERRRLEFNFFRFARSKNIHNEHAGIKRLVCMQKRQFMSSVFYGKK